MKARTKRKTLQVVAAVGTLGRTEIASIKRLTRLDRESIDIDDTPAIDGIYGQEFAHEDTEPLVLVEAGDSLLSGRGSSSPENSAAVRVALGLAIANQRPVRLIHVARTASRHIHLNPQAREAKERLNGVKPDLVFVTMGAADVIDGSTWPQARTDYRYFISTFTRMGAKVVWGTVPPLDAPVPVAESLLASRIMSKKGAQWDENSVTLLNDIAQAGYDVTPLSFQTLMAEFRDHPEYFADKDPQNPIPDPFHPGDLGQRVAAELVVPLLVAALYKPGDAHPQQRNFTMWGDPVQGRTMSTPPLRRSSFDITA